jgi:hypothetical protein
VYLISLNFYFSHNLGSKADNSANDLSPSQSTFGLLSLLKDILSSTSVLDEQPQQLEEIISAVIEPLVQSLASAGGSFSTTGKTKAFSTTCETKANSCVKKLRTSRMIGKVDT